MPGISSDVSAPGAEEVYCTMLLNDGYLPGAQVLAHSLRDAGVTRKLAVMIVREDLSAATLAVLESLYDYVIPVEKIYSQVHANLALMGRTDLNATFTKINLWRLTQFRKIVYIDADVVALRAPEELFDLETEFAAAPDIGWPDIFNSGVMVLKPDEGVFAALQSLAQQGISFDGADQGLLNTYFKQWHRLSFTYNVTPSGNYQYAPAYKHFESTISLAHFIGADKPWKAGKNPGYSSGSYGGGGSNAYAQLVARWWAVWDRHYRQVDSSVKGSRSVGSYHYATNTSGGYTTAHQSGNSNQHIGESTQYNQNQYWYVQGNRHQPKEAYSPRRFAYSPPQQIASPPRTHHVLSQASYEPRHSQQPQQHVRHHHRSYSGAYSPPRSRALPISPPSPAAPERKVLAAPAPARTIVPEAPAAPKEEVKAPEPANKAVFPWERPGYKPSRVFQDEDNEEEDEENDDDDATERGSVTSSVPTLLPMSDHEMTETEDDQSETESETHPIDSPPSYHSPVEPPQTPANINWDHYVNRRSTNQWDDDPAIGRYVAEFRRKHSIVPGPAERRFVFEREGAPSMPVTPNPLQHGAQWIASQRFQEAFPPAEGLPAQTEWDPNAKLAELSRLPPALASRSPSRPGLSRSHASGPSTPTPLPTQQNPFTDYGSYGMMQQSHGQGAEAIPGPVDAQGRQRRSSRDSSRGRKSDKLVNTAVQTSKPQMVSTGINTEATPAQIAAWDRLAAGLPVDNTPSTPPQRTSKGTSPRSSPKYTSPRSSPPTTPKKKTYNNAAVATTEDLEFLGNMGITATEDGDGGQRFVY